MVWWSMTRKSIETTNSDTQLGGWLDFLKFKSFLTPWHALLTLVFCQGGSNSTIFSWIDIWRLQHPCTFCCVLPSYVSWGDLHYQLLQHTWNISACEHQPPYGYSEMLLCIFKLLLCKIISVRSDCMSNLLWCCDYIHSSYLVQCSHKEFGVVSAI